MGADTLESRAASALATLTVSAVERVGSDTVAIRLAAPTGEQLPPWAPGDHVTVEFAPGLARQYSLCGAAGDPEWTIAVRRDPQSTGGSQFAHESLAVGSGVRVAGVRAAFPLEPADRYIFIAGGIGITPILTMAEHVAARGGAFRLTSFDRGAERIVFQDRIAALGGAARTVDRDIHDLTLAEALGELDGALVYFCGPDRMLDELRMLVPAAQLRFESFTPETISDSLGGGSAFEVQLGEGGDVHPVPAGCSLLDVLLKAGVDVVWSCREGNCASCETPVLEGIPEHHDVILSDEEKAANDVMFPCVSRARSARLVLDV